MGEMRRRGNNGAGLGLNAPLRFGVLMESCGRAGLTAANVAAVEAGTKPEHGGKETEDKEGQTALWGKKD